MVCVRHSSLLHAIGLASNSYRHELRLCCVRWWCCDLCFVLLLVWQEALLRAAGWR